MPRQFAHNPPKLKVYPSDFTRSARRRMQRRREQTARQQRWTDACNLFEMTLKSILNQDEDEQVRRELQSTINKINKRLKSKQSDEQIVLNAVRAGCWTVVDIVDETGFTPKFARERLMELLRGGRVVMKESLYQSAQTVQATAIKG
jgi:type VI protein secretion system component VasF